MNVAEQLVSQLIDAGVHRVYGIVGDSLNPVVDAIRKSGGSKRAELTGFMSATKRPLLSPQPLKRN